MESSMNKLRKLIAEAVLVYLISVVCMAKNVKEDNMVRYLKTSNYTQGKAEIVFLLDRSGSVGAADFEVELGFIESFLTHVVVDVNATRVAIISYSDTAVKHIDYLLQPKNKCFLSQELRDVVYEDSAATNIAAAFEEARLVFKNARPNVNKVVVLVSDGLATRGGDPVKVASKLKAEGVEIFCFGVGRFLQTELENMASSLQHVYTCSGFKEFKRLARKIRGDPHESSWSNQSAKPKCDHLCNSPYKGEPYDPGCCDHDARCSCALLSGLHTCVCNPGYYGLSGLAGACRACPRATYKSKLEPSSSCTPCPPGSTTAEIASTKLSDCYCQEGYTGDPSKNISCKRINCPPLQKPSNGYIIGACDTKYGSRCHFMCEEGFEFVNPFSDVRDCKSNGEWSGETTVCRAIRCNPPQKPRYGFVRCDREPFTVGKKCYFSCMMGYIIVGSTERECMSSKMWTGNDTKCLTIECEVPPRLTNGRHNCGWRRKPSFMETCAYNCNNGFRLEGTRFLTCNQKGKLVDALNKYAKHYRMPTCIDETPPEIRCPRPMRLATEKGKNFAIAKWRIPQPTDNSGYTPKLITEPLNIYPNQKFLIGENAFKYIAIDNAGHKSSCAVEITVIDNEPPVVVRCPSRQEVSTNDVVAKVFWKTPEFRDNSNMPLYIKKSATSGDTFQQGSHRVTYTAFDRNRNTAICHFEVTVSRTSCPYHPPPINGAFACDDFMLGKMCRAYCNENYEFRFPPARWYVCGKNAQWGTIPAHERIPWPDCATPALPGEVRQMVGFYYPGDCNDPAVQHHIKKLFLYNYSKYIKSRPMCSRGACSIKDITVKCGKIIHNLGRRKRDVWQHAENEQLELEFDITINADEEMNDTEVLLQDFLETIRNLKWDIDEEITIATLPSNMLLSEENPGDAKALVVADEKTTLVCKPGSILSDNLCVICSAGTYYNSTLRNCIDCPVGSYQESEGQFRCSKCPFGTNTENTRTRNATSCKGVCRPGTYSETGLETCIACPIGKYQEDVGKSECHKCPNGTTTENLGTISLEDCRDVCTPGTFSDNGLQPCEFCPRHHYQPNTGQTECVECPENFSTEEMGATQIINCKDINPCIIENSCLNGGSCTRRGREAVCKCTSGFEGAHCERDINECDQDPCSNGGTCINTDGSFICTCRDGFAGYLCDAEIDECLSNPCHNGGTCLDKINGYICICSSNYEGTNCEMERQLCFLDVVCLNGGTCMFVEDGNASYCVCAPGFSDKDCSFNINDCENITCGNNGSCIDGINSFTCACLQGYTGAYCEINIDDCENNSCHNGSTCQDLIGSYKCLCPPGWNGTHCENEMSSDFILAFPETTATIANMATMTLNSSLSDATVSLWVQTNDTERSGTPLSYAVASTTTTNGNTIVDNALTISDCLEVKVYVNNEPVVTDLQVADGQWHHLAFTWSSENSGTWALYKDGQLKQQGQNLRANDIISGGGKMIIGQEQDTVGGGFNPIETFTGNITRVNIWNTYFSKNNITRLCNLDDELPDKVLAWPDFLQGLQGDVQIFKDSRPTLK